MTTCPCCGSTDLVAKTETYRLRDGTDFVLNVNECQTCHESFEADPAPVPEAEP